MIRCLAETRDPFYRLRCLTRDNDKLRGVADPKITGTGFALIRLQFMTSMSMPSQL